ncbi:hypothetical protein ABPG72_006843 [Tetrahymena utriculariae]
MDNQIPVIYNLLQNSIQELFKYDTEVFQNIIQDLQNKGYTVIGLFSKECEYPIFEALKNNKIFLIKCISVQNFDKINEQINLIEKLKNVPRINHFIEGIFSSDGRFFYYVTLKLQCNLQICYLNNEGHYCYEILSSYHLILNPQKILYSTDKDSFYLSDYGILNMNFNGINLKTLKLEQKKYMAPEVLCNSQRSSNRSDVQSLGLILLELTQGFFMENDKAFELKISFKLHENICNEAKEHQELNEIIQKMLSIDVKKRISPKNLVKKLDYLRQQQQLYFKEQLEEKLSSKALKQLEAIFSKSLDQIDIEFISAKKAFSPIHQTLASQSFSNLEIQSQKQNFRKTSNYFQQNLKKIRTLQSKVQANNKIQQKKNSSKIFSQFSREIDWQVDWNKLQQKYLIQKDKFKKIYAEVKSQKDNYLTKQEIKMKCENSNLQNSGLLLMSNTLCYLYKVSRHLKQCLFLSNLTLFFDRNQISDNGFIGLSSNLLNDWNGTNLALSFTRNLIKDLGISNLANSIANASIYQLSNSVATCSSLSSVRFQFDYNQISNSQTIIQLGQSLSTLTQIYYLKLSFYGKDFKLKKNIQTAFDQYFGYLKHNYTIYSIGRNNFLDNKLYQLIQILNKQYLYNNNWLSLFILRVKIQFNQITNRLIMEVEESYDTPDFIKGIMQEQKVFKNIKSNFFKKYQ